ncbi:MAG: hypothetical protein ACREKN_06295 [Longimicrobiaceae bacterium]
MAIAGFLLTFPALVVMVLFFNRIELVLAALASVLFAALPFLVAAVLIRARRKKGRERTG